MHELFASPFRTIQLASARAAGELPEVTWVMTTRLSLSS
jgi:hypothetical protein